MQIPSKCRNLVHGRLVNRKDDILDDRWDFSVHQYCVLRISIGSVGGRVSVTGESSNQRIAFLIAYGVNQFLRIVYGVNQFLGIGACRIADC